MFGMGLLKGLRATGTHFVKPKVTELYPEQRPDLAPASQGFFDYDVTKCIACGLCERACPNHVIKVGSEKNEEGKKVVTSYVMEVQYCLFCGMCIEACPTKALVNSNNFEIGCYNREGTNYEFMDAAPHKMNEAFNKVQADYWNAKRPEGNPIGRPEPVKVVPPKPATKPAAPAAAKPAAPAAPKAEAPAPKAEAPAPAAKAEEGKGAEE